MMGRKISLLLLLLVKGLASFAQQDLTLYYMDRIPQANFVNPSMMPESNYNFGIPLLSSNYFSLSNSGFHYNALHNVDRMIDRLGRRNFLMFSSRIDLLSVGIKHQKQYFSFNVTEQVHGRFIYPQALLVLAWEGNAGSLLGARADMDKLGVDLMHYREYAFGYTREINNKLTLGGRAKYISGFHNIWTKRSQLGLTTNEAGYGLLLDGALEVNTSGVGGVTNGGFNPAQNLLNAGNHGMGLDIGANYKYSKKLSFSATVLDFGFIRWKNNIRNYRQDDFEFRFDGIDISDLIGTDASPESSLQSVVDSLENTFLLRESEERYTTMLHTRFMLGSLYQIDERFSAGALFHGAIVKGRFRPAMTLSMNSKLTRWFSGTVSYSAYNRSWSNLGLGLVFNAGAAQFFVVSDNVLTPFFPQHFRNAHLRFGFNITAGRPVRK